MTNLKFIFRCLVISKWKFLVKGATHSNAYCSNDDISFLNQMLYFRNLIGPSEMTHSVSTAEIKFLYPYILSKKKVKLLQTMIQFHGSKVLDSLYGKLHLHRHYGASETRCTSN